MSGSTVNTPRYRITVNGQILDGVTNVRVSLPFGFRIGQFDFVKAFFPGDIYPPSWWAATASKSILINIELSLDGTNFQQIITGNVDNHQYDPIGNKICVAGRDLAASMCDERIISTFRNLTASQVAMTFATEHGLNTSVTETTILAGRYYDVDHDEIQAGDFSAATNEWDLLCRLGSEEGIVPYVFGSTLYFNPPPTSPPIFSINCSRSWTGEVVSNVSDLKLERQMTAARDVLVTVRSWNSRKKVTFSSTVRTKTKVASSSNDVVPSNHIVIVPNLSQAQCLVKAQQLALDYSQHERNLVATLPWTEFIVPQTVILLSGTGTDYDMSYFPQTVSYSCDCEHGTCTEIVAKNSSALSVYDDDTDEQIAESSNF